ncbi:hypothetical protein CC2G_007068 [Coprinopsis cinerea AmutBmut pab1-1]|nr:hypothetical protein CC2G_007068 [Coprinopsis cinerea AmutBmut pab1-1]
MRGVSDHHNQWHLKRRLLGYESQMVGGAYSPTGPLRARLYTFTTTLPLIDFDALVT